MKIQKTAKSPRKRNAGAFGVADALASVVDLVERHSETVAPNAFVAIANAAGNDHVYFGATGQLEYFFHPSAVEAFERAGVVTFVGHSNHKGLSGQTAAFVYHHACIAFGKACEHGSEKAYAHSNGFAKQSQQSEKATVDKGHGFVVVQFTAFDAVLLSRPGCCVQYSFSQNQSPVWRVDDANPAA